MKIRNYITLGFCTLFFLTSCDQKKKEILILMKI